MFPVVTNVPKIKTFIQSDSDYLELEKVVRDNIASLSGPLYITDAQSLAQTFLMDLPRDRQHYNCHACRDFLNKYGRLASIGPNGQKYSPIFSGRVPAFFGAAVDAVREAVMTAKIIGIFVNDSNVWGKPVTGQWTHLSGKNEMSVWHSKLRSAEAREAEYKEDFKMLCHALELFSMEHAKIAVRLLEADALDRSEKTLGVAKWFLDLHTKIQHGVYRNNLIWQAVATAPTGFAHIRSSMIGTLLEDIVAGMDFDVVQARWNKKMHPLQYQRAQVAPTAGNVKRANEIFETLGLASAMKRRFAKIEEVRCFWKPTPLPETKEGRFFDHLIKKKSAQVMELPETKITWVRFQSKVLPNVRKMEFLTKAAGSYYGMVTGPQEPKLFQWDNPVSWFFYHGGSTAGKWNLPTASWIPVTGLCEKPCHWDQEFKSESRCVFMILEGAKNLTHVAGGSFFTESLRGDLREVRSTLEAYAKENPIEGKEEGTANGYALQEGMEFNVQVRVHTLEGPAKYIIDRWE